MKTQIFYPEFSERRYKLRQEWLNSDVRNWLEFLQLAENKAIKVADALNENLKDFTHKQILNTYLDLYKNK